MATSSIVGLRARGAAASARWGYGPPPNRAPPLTPQIPQTQKKTAVPPHAGNDNGRVKLALAKQGRSSGSHAINPPNAQIQHFPCKHQFCHVMFGR